MGRDCVRPLFHWSPGATEREGCLEGRPPPPPDAPAEQLILGKFTRGKLCSWEMLEGVLSAARGF